MSPKVTCFIIAPIRKGYVINKKCLDSVLGQDYENFDVLIHYEKPKVYKSEDFPTDYGPIQENIINSYKNCSDNRNVARKMALTTDSDYFLVLDDDVELSINAISNFMVQTGEKKTSIPVVNPRTKEIIPVGTPVPEKYIQGGWYPIYGHDTGKILFYPCGEFVGDMKFEHYYQPQASLTRVDALGVGCMFITRKALQEIEFQHGLNMWTYHASFSGRMIHGECLEFGNRAHEKGYSIYMNGDVICKHHKKGLLKRRILWQIQLLKTSFMDKMRTASRSWNGTKLQHQTR